MFEAQVSAIRTYPGKKGPQAAQKIAMASQRLQGKDSNRRQGYVAAWYVSV